LRVIEQLLEVPPGVKRAKVSPGCQIGSPVYNSVSVGYASIFSQRGLERPPF
jgi:hypothetical protein